MDESPEATVSSHAHLYKYKDKHQHSQHERRLQILSEQKNKRHIEVDKNRVLCDEYLKEFDAENIKQEVESDVEDSKPVVKSDVEDLKSVVESDVDLKQMDETIVEDFKQLKKSEQELDEYEDMEYVQTDVHYSRRLPFKFKLMLTEWFIDIPDDLEENWLCKFTPEGFRVLLIACKRNTNIFTMKSRYLFKLRTHFHGGGGMNPTGVTVLDCIYDKHNKTFFVLDCLYWSAMNTLDSEANFRFYWLKTKFYEMPELSKSVSKKYTFHLIEAIPLERSLLQEKIFQPFKIEGKEILYDGLVCYHSCGFYTFDYSPLATWLYCYMLPEKLGIDVPEIYLAKKPKGYINFQQYIDSKLLARERCDKKKDWNTKKKKGKIGMKVEKIEMMDSNAEMNQYNIESGINVETENKFDVKTSINFKVENKYNVQDHKDYIEKMES